MLSVLLSQTCKVKAGSVYGRERQCAQPQRLGNKAGFRGWWLRRNSTSYRMLYHVLRTLRVTPAPSRQHSVSQGVSCLVQWLLNKGISGTNTLRTGRDGKPWKERASTFQVLTKPNLLDQTGIRRNPDAPVFQDTDQLRWTHPSMPSRGLRTPSACGSARSCPVCSPAKPPHSLQSMLEERENTVSHCAEVDAGHREDAQPRAAELVTEAQALEAVWTEPQFCLIACRLCLSSQQLAGAGRLPPVLHWQGYKVRVWLQKKKKKTREKSKARY